MSNSDLWSPTQSPQTMPDGQGESFEAYRAKLGKRKAKPITITMTQQHLRRHPEKIARFNKVRIWSGQWKMWWRPRNCGYTKVIDDAGIYDAKEALLSVRHCGPEKKIVLVSV